jgi:predicted PurR-regulated permease PerM
MARGGYIPDWQRALIALSATVVLSTVVLALYWAQSIFIPIALAVFMTFVLSPVVSRLQHRGLGRTPAVILTVGLAVLVAGGAGTLIAQQLSNLAGELARPDRAEEIKKKVAEAKDRVTGGQESKFGQLVEDVTNVLFPKPAKTRNDQEAAGVAVAGGAAVAGHGQQPDSPFAHAGKPVPVVVETEGSWLSRAGAYASPAVEFVGQATFAFILTVFMLLKKEDLRNRMIRLTGHGKVTTTTKAVDDASRRVSKFLFAQLMLNASFGLIIVVGLYLAGVEYAVLWGAIAFLMRYVPYIGTWVGLLPPTVFAFAMYPEVWKPVAVLALFGVLELLCNNIFEPLLYGKSMGLSEVAQLVAAAFWAFLWGPIGLVLSGPLTVCLLVLGKYVSRFQYFEILLGDEPVLEPRVAFYQRLAARDQDEASDIARAALGDDGRAAMFDDVIIPALCLAKRDEDDGDLSADDKKFIVKAAREIGEEVAAEAAPEPSETAEHRVRVLLCPARDEVDFVGVELLGALLDPGRWEVEVSAAEILASELLARIDEFQPAAVVIGAVPPGGLSHTRYLVARLRARFPDLKVVIGRWGRGEDFPDEPAQPGGAGADWTDTTLAQTRKRLNDWYGVFTAEAEPDAAEKPALVGTAAASEV